MKVKYSFKTHPDPHQLDALKRAVKHNRYGLFFQQRVGKTKVAIDFCGVKAMSNKIKKVLIVCPLSVRTEWIAQIEEHLGAEHEALLYPKIPKSRKSLLRKTSKPEKLTFIVTNYDVISHDVDALVRWKADVIIFDESHLIKTHSSKRSKAAYKLSKSTTRVLLLTGTPIPKRWYDIFGQFRALDDTIFGSSWTKFRLKYALMGGYMGKEIIGCADYDAISAIIANHSIRVLRSDVFDEPSTDTPVIPVDFEPKARALYDELRKQYVAELDNESFVTASMATTRLMRLQQFCGGFIKTDEGDIVQVSSAKLNVLKDLVRTKVDGGEQVVIFHRYTAEGDAIRKALAEFRVSSINGSVDETNRKKARDTFQEGGLDAIVVQIATGAMGITLDRAHINIFYSLDFSLSNYQQAKDRIMGRNQHSDVTNYFIVVEKSIDAKVMKTLKKDEDIASSIQDKWRWLLKEEE